MTKPSLQRTVHRMSYVKRCKSLIAFALFVIFVSWLTTHWQTNVELVTKVPAASRESPKISTAFTNVTVDVACENAVKRVIENNIQLIAFDFDWTIIDIHTGGRWKKSVQDLIPHVRSEFQCFISRCLDNGIVVVIATFSTQSELIRDVLVGSIQNKKVADIAIFGGDAYVPSKNTGKQSQLILGLEYVNRARSLHERVEPRNVLLVDDDPRNIETALHDGYATLHFDPRNSNLFAPFKLEYNKLAVSA